VGPPPLDRSLFPVTERWAYLDHAHTGVPPTPVAAAMTAAVERQSLLGSAASDGHESAIEGVRTRAAALLGVPAAHVAFVKNTTEGLGFVASGLEWRPGDRVLLPDDEFPSTAYPWLALADRGVVVDRVPVHDLPGAVSAGEPPTVVATSWVQAGRGYRTDLAGLARRCHDAGALLVVDAVQGLGVIPADLAAWGVDAAAASAFKWQLGPEGAGVLYIRDELQDRLRVLEPGWNSVAARDAYDDRALVLDPTARRFEGGTLNTSGILGLGASLELLAAAGVDRIWSHVDALCDRLVHAVTDAGATVVSDRSPTARSAIVNFTVPGHEPAAVKPALRTEGVVVSARAGGVRVAPHGYCTEDDIDRVAAGVGRLTQVA
jgi:cysteine desulfurase/selenocysteine lyase